MEDARSHMDAIYRFQRHIYDLTRKPYLLGRDVLIRELAPPPQGTVLEIGCGTARNLLRISELYPNARCFGLDVSTVMLETANASIARAGRQDRVRVACADATAFDPQVLFGVDRFDRIVISYALSMIPDWERVLHAGAGLLAAGGSLHVVDFGDQAHLPAWFKSLLYAWLDLFDVSPRQNLPERVVAIAGEHGQIGRSRSLYGGYATIADMRMA